MSVAASLFDDASPEPNAFGQHLRVTDGLFSSGSPASSALAATFVPSIFPKTSRVPGNDVPLVLKKNAIPYHFHGGTSQDLIVKSATQDGAERAVFNNGLSISGEIWHPPQLSERGGKLKTDFLLLTVVPWSRAGGGYAAIASGAHGPASLDSEFSRTSRSRLFPIPFFAAKHFDPMAQNSRRYPELGVSHGS
jgi:hypothetical protein